MNLCIYSQSITKEAITYNGEKNLFKKWCLGNWIAIWKRKKKIRTFS